ncbi:MAG: IS66 family insertion sequence element accessory protein TnpB [Moritella sp.]|uniref:IS66 family insertion sequence element accessory protein TnpA n=1 Tax=Moritella sp. TaxID=78556 RepID=UPI0021742B34|nr:IS66 family insertion sequence element accessory protein TnpB [Moritella sp.]MBL1418285.1 IS66 family insertion sequence element accessory protein TnpB [Moritella sp.]
MSKSKKEQHWQRIFQLQAESRLNKSEFCKRNNIAVSTFYAWAKKLSPQPPKRTNKQKVIPLVFPETKPDQQLTLTLPNGYQFSFPASLEPSKLQQFLSVLSA